MRKVNSTIHDVINQIIKLKGKDVSLEIARGRKKPQTISGFIESVYPSIFTVRSHDSKNDSSLSYSYADVLCGDVSIKELSSREEINELEENQNNL